MEKELTLTQEIEINDDVDRILLEDLLMIVQNTDTFTFIRYWGHMKLKIDKTDEQFFKKVMPSINALVKANAYRRNYKKIKDSLISDIENSDIIKGTNVEMLFEKVDAIILIEGFLSQIKTSLDLLAQSLKWIYRIEFHTWGKKNGISGQEIIDRLNNNLNKELKPHALPVIELIEKNKEHITKIVKCRDDHIHYGKIQRMQGFRYSPKYNKVMAPLILINPTQSAYVHEYMDEELEYITGFVQQFIITLLSNLMGGMYISKRKDGSWGWFSTTLK